MSSKVSEARQKHLGDHNIALQQLMVAGKYSEVWKGLLNDKEPVILKFFGDSKNAMANAMRELSFMGYVFYSCFQFLFVLIESDIYSRFLKRCIQKIFRIFQYVIFSNYLEFAFVVLNK